MFAKETYVNRRNRLVASLKDNSGLLLFLGNSEASYNYPDNQYLFRQDSTFLYYFGIDKPDFAAVIDLDNGKEIIFGNDVDIDDIIWMGPQPSVADQAAEVGVTETLPFAKLSEMVKEAIAKGRKVHYLPPYRNHNKIMIHQMFGYGFDEINPKASLDFVLAVVAMRLIKEPCEIAEIDKACDLGYVMHYTAMKMMKPGIVEQELVGVMEGIARTGYAVSFPIILSMNGETLHNHSHHQILTDGRLCVIDAGVEIASHYASDHTRTLPCGGRFTQQQKEIYKIVSDANNQALAMARPGITYKDVHLEAARTILRGLSALGLVHGDIDEMTAAGVQGLFMPHGLGHNMGIDVHDMEDLGENHVGYAEGQERAKQLGLGSLRMARPLEVGHVITDEPGIYFIPALIEQWKANGTNAQYIDFEKLKAYYTFGGIRLEDDLLITPDGCRLLGSKRLPITVEDVEKEMNS